MAGAGPGDSDGPEGLLGRRSLPEPRQGLFLIVVVIRTLFITINSIFKKRGRGEVLQDDLPSRTRAGLFIPQVGTWLSGPARRGVPRSRAGGPRFSPPHPAPQTRRLGHPAMNLSLSGQPSPRLVHLSLTSHDSHQGRNLAFIAPKERHPSLMH